MPETPRFVPIGQMPQGGTGASLTGGDSSRFIPISGNGASGGSNGLNLPGLFNQFQGLNQQGGGAGGAIAKGAGMLGSGLGAINKAGDAWSTAMGGVNPIPTGVGSTLGLAGGALGLGSGIYNLAKGDYSAAPGVLSGGLGLAGTLGGALGSSAVAGLGGSGAAALAGGGAAGMAAAAGPLASALSTAGAVGGTLALPLAGVGIGLSNMMKKEADRAKKQTIESGDIRRGYAEAYPNVIKGMQVAQSLDRVNALTPGQQIQALQQARGYLQKAAEDLASDFSRFVNTGGQGGAASKVGKTDVSGAAALSAQAGPDITIGLARVLDALAQRGVVLNATEMGPTTMQSPAALLSALAGPSGLPAGYNPYATLTPGQLAGIGPGNLEQFIRGTLGQQNPGFAQSRAAGRFTALPAVTAPANAAATLQGVLPQYLAARDQYNQEQIQPYLTPPPPPAGGGANMALGSQLAYAPYTQGGLATLLGPRGYALFKQGADLYSIPGRIQQEDDAARFAAGGGN